MSTPAPPRDRYGRGPAAANRRRPALVAAVLLAAGVAYAAWVGMAGSGGGIGWNDVGYRVQGPAAVDVTFDVSVPDAATPVVCTLRALNASHAVVGLIDTEVTPVHPGTFRLTRTVPTSETAVTGVVKACARRP